MKTNHALSTVLLLALSAPQIRADEASEKIVDRAIAAQGGAANLARTKQMIRKAAGVINVPGGELPFIDEMTFDLPDRVRHQIDLGGADNALINVVNSGAEGWQVTGGITQDMNKARVAEMREEMYVLYVTGLAPLRTDRQIALTALPEEKLPGQALDVVKVSRAGYGDVQLYFDKATGNLVRLTRKSRAGGMNVEKDYRWSEFKDFDGAKLPTKEILIQNERKFSEVKAADYSFPRAVNERAFGKP